MHACIYAEVNPQIEFIQILKYIFLGFRKKGNSLVFAITIKLIPEFWRNLEILEKFLKIYEQVKLDLFQNFYLFLTIISIPEFCHLEPRPTTPQT